MSEESDIKAVKTLSISSIDKNREFVGLANLKTSKKDRHLKTIKEFSVFLEQTNEKVEQEVLRLTRAFRETLEVSDEDLYKFCLAINEDSFLIPKSERELIDVLEKDMKIRIQRRCDIVEKFGIDLDNTETKRAEVAGIELKRLVDKLIAIAHQLPNDIEHIVEAEAFELNTEIITRKTEHAKNVAAHQISHVKLEAETLQKWENCRMKWRLLRHEKGINDFRAHIISSDFTDPSDRQIYMRTFRDRQQKRQQAMQSCIKRLQTMTAHNITSKQVQIIQTEIASINEQEMTAIQTCYNELNRLQGDVSFSAAERVEALRRELHGYGALKIEPELTKNAAILKSALNNDALTELWRLGGGLKPEFQAQVNDLCCNDVIYDRLVVSMQQRMELITCGFTLKSVLEERGRLAQLEKVRNMITKMRTAPRQEVTSVLLMLLPELLSMEEIEQLPALFKTQVKEIAAKIAEELTVIDKKQGISSGIALSAATLAGSTSGTALKGNTSDATVGKSNTATKTKNTATKGKTSATATPAATLPKTAATVSSSATTNSATSIVGSVSASTAVGVSTAAASTFYVDPAIVKIWNRRLGALYYSSDLPLEYQQACIEELELINCQNECNKLVDAVVLQESAVQLVKLARRYKKCTDSIASYLETQSNLISQTAVNIGDFFLAVSKMVEKHRQQQKALDDQSADELWDLREDFRFEKEDLEALYAAACQRLRESITQEDLQQKFEEVLKVLQDIQESYRVYHSKACFASDKYPLILIQEFRAYMNTFCAMFFLIPDASHTIVTEYERIFDQTVRFNRKYFESDNSADTSGIAVAADGGGSKPIGAGVERIPLPNVPPIPATSVSSSNTINENNGTPLVFYSPYLLPNNSNNSAVPAVDGKSAAVVLVEPPPDVYTGSYYWTHTLDAVAARFKDESAFAVQETVSSDSNDAAAIIDDAANVSTTVGSSTGRPMSSGDQLSSGSAGGNRGASATIRAKAPHDKCPYIAAKSPVLPLREAEIKQLDDLDREDYETALVRYFISLGDLHDIQSLRAQAAAAIEAAAALATAAPVVPVKGGAKKSSSKTLSAAATITASLPVIDVPVFNPQLAAMNAAELEQYQYTFQFVEEVKQRKATEADVQYILSHPPVDAHGNLWVKVVEITPALIKSLVTGIRDSIIVLVEQEAFKRILTAEKRCSSGKAELTDELEDRLRNHWPRRGRVETQIKQPREAELLGHKEKTWRLISSIQQKMVAAQDSFTVAVMAGHKECDEYVKSMTELRNSLSGNFKSLAFLQGIDVRARGTTNSFQSQSTARNALLTQIALDETASIISFARDFRKICPPQTAGEEGGYSESEIAEIEQIVEGQCAEIESITQEWQQNMTQLAEQQTQSMKCQDEFSIKYKKSTQDVAMSEGLGQTYGAPRRRAQERIRTEVSRDERSAGKIDELLAQLEFACSEAEMKSNCNNNSIKNNSIPATDLPEPPLKQADAIKQQQLKEGNSLSPVLPSVTSIRKNSSNNTSTVATDTMSAIPSTTTDGEDELFRATLNWNLLLQLRLSLKQRVDYLRVLDETAVNGTASSLLVSCKEQLPWLSKERMAPATALFHTLSSSSTSNGEISNIETVQYGAKELAAIMEQAPKITLEELYQEVDTACRQETRKLYESEGLAGQLLGGNAGVPEALQQWLADSKDKLFGKNGHREKAWKRLWEQVQRSENILARHLTSLQQQEDNQENTDANGNDVVKIAVAAGSPAKTNKTASITKTNHMATSATTSVVHTDNSNLVPETNLTTTTVPVVGSKYTTKLGIPAICLRFLTDAFIHFARQDRYARTMNFNQLLKIWEKGREKHERLLRPRMGSPDQASELNQLDTTESQRSAELVLNVKKFRTLLVRGQTEHLTRFLEDMALCSKSLLQLLDSTVRQELLLVPPDTAVPKKHMTLKKLRKAQRVKGSVAQGGEDRSQSRIWPGIEAQSIVDVVRAAEDLVEDLGSDPKDTAVTLTVVAAAALAAPSAVEKKAKKPDKNAPVAAPIESPKPSLIPPSWVSVLKEKSNVHGQVSTAHRIIISERDAAIDRYGKYISLCIEEIRADYDAILQQEISWNERWKRQVEMLRKGNL